MIALLWDLVLLIVAGARTVWGWLVWIYREVDRPLECEDDGWHTDHMPAELRGPRK